MNASKLFQPLLRWREPPSAGLLPSLRRGSRSVPKPEHSGSRRISSAARSSTRNSSRRPRDAISTPSNTTMPTWRPSSVFTRKLRGCAPCLRHGIVECAERIGRREFLTPIWSRTRVSLSFGKWCNLDRSICCVNSAKPAVRSFFHFALNNSDVWSSQQQTDPRPRVR